MQMKHVYVVPPPSGPSYFIAFVVGGCQLDPVVKEIQRTVGRNYEAFYFDVVSAKLCKDEYG